jgi:hypothetical protein
MNRASMPAQVGDRLVVTGGPNRTGIVTGVRNPDGSPPNVINWRSDGHIAMVFPDQFATIAAADRVHPDAVS